MSLKILRASSLAIALASATAAAAQEETPPPLNTPVYEPQCGPTGLMATFKMCTVQMVPLMTMSINGVPAMAAFSPKVVCSRIGAKTPEALDFLESSFAGPAEVLAGPMAQARADMADPAKACPSAAMF